MEESHDYGAVVAPNVGRHHRRKGDDPGLEELAQAAKGGG